MRPANDRGTPVDPVPFVVVVGSAFLVLFSFGPGYLLAFGVSLPAALGTTTLAFACTAAIAYHRYVWRARPERLEHVPAPVRLGSLYHVVVFGLVVLLLLLVPVHL